MPQNLDGSQQEPRGAATVTLEEVPSVLQLHTSEPSINRRIERTSHQSTRPSVRWEEGTVDNENLNRKKTKICCIFHPQEEIDEDGEGRYSDHEHPPPSPSSSSSSSSSSSESDNDNRLNPEDRRQRRIERRRRKLNKERSVSPNAYEVQPDYSQHRQK
ncbi:type 1 protein phosphatase-activating protein YPI1 NDAI_0B02120 [Naumovozyma dairenensis CBS 421]|uniref:Type 1 phosphatases regulator n=1 Tax=Naumovozyma dairenensis (strain ATCC 10597 / BCRC 20456 / CBS 421 / NBRC 0211 / NRRL Y-12639) TaxID=1071378 RepID=G0W636_NAUDC|nr:hypothetical protein NDAI_0B02120 [Naumovozyma dairenensis CBS 421]CCD23247.1 hypothetical protein NDAI_0B02120 [Naumovozyma dairenensis CBS 421]